MEGDWNKELVNSVVVSVLDMRKKLNIKSNFHVFFLISSLGLG